MNIGITGVAAITVICWLAAQALKASPLPAKWIPILCGVLGGILGVIGKLVMPEFPAADRLTAVAVGIVSGMAASGIDQAGVQLAAGKRVNQYGERIDEGYDGEEGM